jgi:hypothetical protein
MYELRLKDNNSKVYSVSSISMIVVIKKMTKFIIKKYQIEV